MGIIKNGNHPSGDLFHPSITAADRITDQTDTDQNKSQNADQARPGQSRTP